MQVKIEFDGSQAEFEQFCQTPQRLAHAQMLQQYQGWLQQPYPIEVEASPVMPALPGQVGQVGQSYYQTTPLALPATGTGWEPGGYLRPALPYGQNSGWQRWIPQIQLTGPIKFFLLSLCVSIGMIGAVKLRPPQTVTQPQAATPVKNQPQGKFTFTPIQPAKPAAKKGAIPTLPLVPRPGQE